jgi:Protein of unknown function (DUF3892)
MAQSVQISCINKTDRTNPHERIDYVGGVNPDGTRWLLSVHEAIVGIEQGTWEFYVERPTGHRVRVIVATSALGHKYLKTEADGEQPNNLLALPECPR